jgi:SpoIID/LytB domain protein
LQVYRLPPAGKFEVIVHGNGHGHGLSQYGARGAADAGLSTRRILSFYYPGTSLRKLTPTSKIRVKISGGYVNTCVQAKPGLTATGVKGSLPASGSVQIKPFGNGLALRAFAAAHCSGKATRVWLRPTASTVYIHSADTIVRLRKAHGTSTDYFGAIGATRLGKGELTINLVNLDKYTQGVAPREMPATWNLNAVRAQAIAARTYAEYERTQADPAALYDICDTSRCQVYGGKTHYASDGQSVLWEDDPAAVATNRGLILTYKGSVAFTQFSASNGGRTADGGEPYLVAKVDPYDNARSGDPYLSKKTTAAVKRIATTYGLKSVTRIEITGRDGGRLGHVTSALVWGRTSSGDIVSVETTGARLQSVMHLSSTYFAIGGAWPGGGAIAAPVIHVASSHPGGAQLHWNAIVSATRYRLYRNGTPTSTYVKTTRVTVTGNGSYAVVAIQDAAGKVRSGKSNSVTVSGI